jgi:hypothetical protein
MHMCMSGNKYGCHEKYILLLFSKLVTQMFNCANSNLANYSLLKLFINHLITSKHHKSTQIYLVFIDHMMV